MRDDRQKWTPSQSGTPATVETDGVRISSVSPDRLTLISGPIGQSLSKCGMETAAGWPDPVSSDSYALRLRRDRILVVNGPQLKDGWDSESGVAISDMSGAYGVLEVSGPGALNLLRKGTEIDPEERSGSVVRGFHGYPVLLYTVESSAPKFRLHTPRAYLDGLYALLAEEAKE